MNIQFAHANPFVDNPAESTHRLLQDSVENNNGDELVIDLPLEALVSSNFNQCPFMGARSPWANS